MRVDEDGCCLTCGRSIEPCADCIFADQIRLAGERDRHKERADSLQKQMGEIAAALGNPKGCLAGALKRRLAATDRKKIADFLRHAFSLKPGGDPGWNTWQDILARYLDGIEEGRYPL